MASTGSQWFANVASDSYAVGNSAMFDKANTEYFTGTPGAGDQQKWTISFWVKMCDLTTRQMFFGQGASYISINENAQPSNRIYLYIAGSSPVWNWETNATDGLFRDPTAWYNIVVSFDSTNGTADHRLRLYVNGVEFTDFVKSSTGNQNSSQSIGGSSEISIGTHPGNTNNPFDGYMAEYVYIDGTQHTPTSFGEFDSYGVWKPVDVSGLTFGAKGWYLPFSNSGLLGEDKSTSRGLIDPSLGTVGGDMTQNGGNAAAFDGNYLQADTAAARKGGGSTTAFISKDFGSGVTKTITGLRIFGCTNQGFHSDNNTTTVTVTLTGSNDDSSYTALGNFSFTDPGNATPQEKLSGFTASAFRYFKITLSGMPGTGGHLIGEIELYEGANPNGGLNFTNNNTVTQSGDSPTKNFATISSIDKNSGIALANGNLKYTAASTWTAAGITQAPTQKTYWEFRPTSNDLQVGVNNVPSAAKAGTSTYYTGSGVVLWQHNSYWNGGSNSGGKTAWSSGDVCAVAFDPATGKIWFAVNNTWNDSGNPATGSNASVTLAEGVSPGYEFIAAGESGSMVLNFGQDDTFGGTETSQGNSDGNGNGSFHYEPPSGFLALAAASIAEPSVPDGSAHHQAILWSGNSSSQTVSQTGNSGFTPDWAIIKSRSFANGANSFDVVRGSTKGLATFDTGAEDTNSDGVAFGIGSGKGTLGFTGAGNTGDINNSGRTYVGLTWKAGGSASTNEVGSINSSVSVNTTAGISIGTYTGSGSNATIGHGLGIVPRMVWVKNRGGNGWAVYSAIAGEDYYMYLDAEGARVDNSSYWNDTAPTSTVFNIGTTADVNASSGNIVFYAMADVAGYQKIGAYTGNGSADGPMIHTGFKPQYVMIKSTTQGSTNWEFFCDEIEPNNVVGDQNFFNIANAEADNDHKMDWLATGFKIRDSSGSINTGSGTFLYWAIAKYPFGGTCPAPAR